MKFNTPTRRTILNELQILRTVAMKNKQRVEEEEKRRVSLINFQHQITGNSLNGEEASTLEIRTNGFSSVKNINHFNHSNGVDSKFKLYKSHPNSKVTFFLPSSPSSQTSSNTDEGFDDYSEPVYVQLLNGVIELVKSKKHKLPFAELDASTSYRGTTGVQSQYFKMRNQEISNGTNGVASIAPK